MYQSIPSKGSANSCPNLYQTVGQAVQKIRRRMRGLVRPVGHVSLVITPPPNQNHALPIGPGQDQILMMAFHRGRPRERMPGQNDPDFCQNFKRRMPKYSICTLKKEAKSGRQRMFNRRPGQKNKIGRSNLSQHLVKIILKRTNSVFHLPAVSALGAGKDCLPRERDQFSRYTSILQPAQQPQQSRFGVPPFPPAPTKRYRPSPFGHFFSCLRHPSPFFSDKPCRTIRRIQSVLLDTVKNDHRS